MVDGNHKPSFVSIFVSLTASLCGGLCMINRMLQFIKIFLGISNVYMEGAEL